VPATPPEASAEYCSTSKPSVLPMSRVEVHFKALLDNCRPCPYVARSSDRADVLYLLNGDAHLCKDIGKDLPARAALLERSEACQQLWRVYHRVHQAPVAIQREPAFVAPPAQAELQ
jgi:hypothetical protein